MKRKNEEIQENKVQRVSGEILNIPSDALKTVYSFCDKSTLLALRTTCCQFHNDNNLHTWDICVGSFKMKIDSYLVDRPLSNLDILTRFSKGIRSIMVDQQKKVIDNILSDGMKRRFPELAKKWTLKCKNYDADVDDVIGAMPSTMNVKVYSEEHLFDVLFSSTHKTSKISIRKGDMHGYLTQCIFKFKLFRGKERISRSLYNVVGDVINEFHLGCLGVDTLFNLIVNIATCFRFGDTPGNMMISTKGVSSIFYEDDPDDRRKFFGFNKTLKGTEWI